MKEEKCINKCFRCNRYFINSLKSSQKISLNIRESNKEDVKEFLDNIDAMFENGCIENDDYKKVKSIGNELLNKIDIDVKTSSKIADKLLDEVELLSICPSICKND